MGCEGGGGGGGRVEGDGERLRGWKQDDRRGPGT